MSYEKGDEFKVEETTRKKVYPGYTEAMIDWLKSEEMFILIFVFVAPALIFGIVLLIAAFADELHSTWEEV